jgi:DNA-binding HxlR family transcriptional regulator
VPTADDQALADACRLVGDRWSLPVVAALLGGALRYGELQERLPGLAPNILSARLRRLEEEGLLLSTRYSERPPRFEYRLSPDGAALADSIRLLAAWAAGRTGSAARGPIHALCGTALEVRWWCPTCELAATPAEDEPVRV